MVHQLHEGRQSEGQQVAKTTKHARTQTHTQTIGNFSPADGLDQCIAAKKAQMAWDITRNERSAETERGVAESEEERGQKDRKFNAATGLAEEGQKKQRQGREMGQRFAMQCRQTGLRETAGAVRRPAGAGQRGAAFNQDQKAT